MTTSRRSRQAPKDRERVYLGVDPGLARTGYGVIAATARGARLLAYGCIETDAKADKHNRLGKIFDELTDVCRTHTPDEAAVEELFFAQNAKTAFRVGEARGVILLALERLRLPIRHFTPQMIKQTITTYGRADKEQVQKMVKLIFNLNEIPKPDDAADAVACALCAWQTPHL